jgi:hypothetical protein
MCQTSLCGAINSRNLVQFHYTGETIPGTRVVEPHMVAYNRKNHLALSGWLVGGVSGSQEDDGWREYLLTEISSLVVLPERFVGPRPGYKPGGGKAFHSVQCEL